MNNRSPKILMIVGEASGDNHGGALLKSLKSRFPLLECRGIGGESLKNNGMELLYNVREMGVIGFYEVIRSLGFFKKVFREVLELAINWKPDFAVLVDYPGFNLRMARELKKLAIPVVYYISPQVWAWKKKRAQELSSLVDLMIVIFPFEEEIYRKHGGNVIFSGHPLKDSVRNLRTKEETCSELGFCPEMKILAVLPGSRDREVSVILPGILEALPIVHSNVSQVVISVAPTVSRQMVEGIVSRSGSQVVLSGLNIYDLLHMADAAVVAAGTASLEAALANTPTVVVYKLSMFSYMIGKLLVKVEHVSMTNILLGKRVFPELIQSDFTGKKLAAEINSLIMDNERRRKMFSDLKGIREKLGQGNASENATSAICDLIKDSLG